MDSTLLEIFIGVIEKLNKQEILYMVVGSVASTIYGEPRLTHDMDIVIDIAYDDCEKLFNTFNIEDYYCPPLEVLKHETKNHGQFNLIHLESNLKIDCIIRKRNKHAIEEFSRRVQTPFTANITIFIATAEDIIIKKLDYYRQGRSEKHLHDIRGILTETPIDKEYLHKWIRELGLISEWSNV
ncbi:MAG: hypothetical protein HQK50_16430 [Oligoflexia bacterium]|nr:hypothetical protein [Oligoflexia bacterium]